VGDITYITTGEGWLFLAVVIDLFSRKVVGWLMMLYFGFMEEKTKIKLGLAYGPMESICVG